jgi:SAM-dependent methyltransferase
MESRYIHGTHPEEQERLEAMNEMLNPTSVGMMRLRGSRRILDVGCGLGQLARAMARAAGSGARVIGVERSPELIAGATRRAQAAGEVGLIELRQGDAGRLPLSEDEWGTFDLVHSRFLLEHLPEPAPVVRAMVQALRPGGRIILEDDDHANMRLWPEPPGFDLIWNAYVQSFFKLGNDPFIGRRLVSLIHEAEAQAMRASSLSISSCAGSPSFQPLLNIVKGLLWGARDTVIEEGFLDEREFGAGMVSLEAWGHRPDAALWYMTCWAEGRRPGRDSVSP